MTFTIVLVIGFCLLSIGVGLAVLFALKEGN